VRAEIADHSVFAVMTASIPLRKLVDRQQGIPVRVSSTVAFTRVCFLGETSPPETRRLVSRLRTDSSTDGGSDRHRALATGGQVRAAPLTRMNRYHCRERQLLPAGESLHASTAKRLRKWSRSRRAVSFRIPHGTSWIAVRGCRGHIRPDGPVLNGRASASRA
jgi:hypothetical protein